MPSTYGVLATACRSASPPPRFSPVVTAPRLDGALWSGYISGESPDIVSVLDEGRQQGRRPRSITNEPDSPLAEALPAVIDPCR